jgi:excisionase family DNA binding protein
MGEIVIMPSEGDVLTVVEAAALLKVHPVTLRKRAVEWGVPHKRLGTEWRFSRKRLIEFMQEDDNNKAA